MVASADPTIVNQLCRKGQTVGLLFTNGGVTGVQLDGNTPVGTPKGNCRCTANNAVSCNPAALLDTFCTDPNKACPPPQYVNRLCLKGKLIGVLDSYGSVTSVQPDGKPVGPASGDCSCGTSNKVSCYPRSAHSGAICIDLTKTCA
ncbi:hypothetical protein PtA15_15A189 [Puccinia triticina]|uniref:Uncharacterized protein n=1 Tax=Puccinia triticina TaxID=208348 RepID=A0ABY7DA49_9BASI|nr:uncharacterized protein PtA15_15A189 [Puccinia triticina]WAQ91797.1 hypothetical protein PtA15_15A189 [Puccinia triticina]